MLHKSLKNNLIEDLDINNFRKENLEIKPFYKKEIKSFDNLRNIINLEKFERLLWIAHKIQPKNIKIASQHTFVNPYEIQQSDIIQTATKYISKKYCVAINFAEKFCPDISDFTRILGEILQCKAYCSIFFNPPQSNCLSTHYDGIDVIAFQIEGKKQWILDLPIEELPLENNPLEHYTFSEKSKTYLLNESDLLYIPRGYIHNVESQSDYSLHISIGLETYKNADILANYIDSLKLTETILRSSKLESFTNFNLKDVSFEISSLEKSKEKIHFINVSKNDILPNNHIRSALNLEEFNESTKLKVSKGSEIHTYYDQLNKRNLLVGPYAAPDQLDWFYNSMEISKEELILIERIRLSKENFTLGEIQLNSNFEITRSFLLKLIAKNLIELA